MRIRPAVVFTRLLFVGLLAFLLVCGSAALQAQGTAATVTGFVTDSVGARLPNATVTYTNTATGVVSKVTHK